jgi:hypothetical protein
MPLSRRIFHWASLPKTILSRTDGIGEPKNRSTGDLFPRVRAILAPFKIKRRPALPTPMNAGSHDAASGCPSKSGIYFNYIRVRGFIPSGAPEKQVPSVPGLWRLDLLEWGYWGWGIDD